MIVILNDGPIKIGITGEMGVGKSTFARLLSEELDEAPIIPFAKPLKDFALHMGWNGVKDAKGRRLLQLLGTDCGRECIDESVWVRKWQAKVDADVTSCFVIADDVRYLNEALACHYLIKLVHPPSFKRSLRRFWLLSTGRLHTSEYGISENLVNRMITNDHTSYIWSELLNIEAQRAARSVKELL